jgi:hypothetical protein
MASQGRVSPESARRHLLPTQRHHALAALRASEVRALADTERTRCVEVEAARPLVLLQHVTERVDAVLHAKRPKGW